MEITLKELNHFFTPNFEKGTLTWNLARGGSVKRGQLAGCFKDRYYQVIIRGKTYMLHRLLYFMYHGKIDQKMYIDHIDGDPRNNSIDNLRMCTPRQNSRNRKKANCTSSTGYLNVHQGTGKDAGSWKVVIQLDFRKRKNFTKMFSKRKYTLEEVADYAHQKRIELFGEFTHNHKEILCQQLEK